MKPIALVLTASLLANLAFVAAFVTRPAAQKSDANYAAPSNNRTAVTSAASTDALRAALASGDVAALEAAGISGDIARELATGRTFSRLAEKLRAGQARQSTDPRWWRNRPGAASGTREQQLVARRELSDALTAAFGDDLGLGGGEQSHLAFLSPAKRDALRRVNQDYDEMMAKFSAGGIQLASDREKLRLLRQERDRDIAALLTPEERAAYEMRTSISGNIVRSRFGDAIESEGEFQKVYELQKAFDEKFPREALTGRISPEIMRARSEAERQLDAEIRAAVGDDRYAALRRAADSDVRTVDSLVQRLGLPATTTDHVLASRDSYSLESQRITNDTSLTLPQRRTEIQALAAQAKADLARSLGAEAAEAYAQRSPWISLLQGGMAYSATPQDGSPGSLLPGGPSVHPVMPAGTIPPGAPRQFVFNATPTLEGGLVQDAFVSSGNVQVVSFASSGTSDPTNAVPDDGTVVRRLAVGVPQTAPGTPVPPTTPAPQATAPVQPKR